MKRVKVLVVDDDALMRTLLRLILAPKYELVFATNGQEALDAYDAHAIDVVILDIVMPDLDGFAICQGLRQRSDVPVIMLSVLSRPVDLARATAVGANAYLIKPFTARDLHQQIASVITTH